LEKEEELSVQSNIENDRTNNQETEKDEIKNNNRKELETSFIKKNIETQGKSPLRYIEKKGIELYKCDHRKREKDYNQNKKPINKIHFTKSIVKIKFREIFGGWISYIFRNILLAFA